MTTGRGVPPRWASALLRWWLRGEIGRDARADLEDDFAELSRSRGRSWATVVYLSHLVRPGTWALGWELRRREDPDRAPRRGLPWVSWLDVKLGVRMLVKHPALTLVSGLAMSLTIAVAIAAFSLFQDWFLRPPVPLPEGDRIVSLGMLATDRRLTYRQLLHDVPVWRAELETVELVSITRDHRENIVGEDGIGELSAFTMMSASGFEVARIPPLLGRTLLAGDEAPGAAPVVVLGYDDWIERYDGATDVIGRTMQIGEQAHTIVGVMPDGYAFPATARRWLPFTDDPDDFALLETPYLYRAFGRLTPGATMEAANAEISGIGRRRAHDLPESHGHLRALAMHYTDSYTGMDNAGGLLIVRVVLALLTLLVVVPFANVAILIYARTATRAGELSIRNALGAGRGRIVSQLFIESLVLASLSAAVGVAIVAYGYGFVDSLLAGIGGADVLPFWVRKGRDPWVAAYVVGLTLSAAVVSGVLPGLKATGRGVREELSRAANGNGMRLGGVWTAMIVFQVATTVGLIPFAASMGWQLLGAGLTRPSFDAEPLVGAFVAGPRRATASTFVTAGRVEDADRRLRAELAVQELRRQVSSDPRVRQLTFASDMPGSPYGASILVEIEGVAPPDDASAHRVGGRVDVAADYFDVLGVETTAGRSLHPTDRELESSPIVVNQAFVDRILGGANAVGRRVRPWLPEAETLGSSVEAGGEGPAPWSEIVGVVDNLTLNPTHPDRVESRIYLLLDEDRLADGVFFVMRVPDRTQAYIPELRRMATAVDPTLVVGVAVRVGEAGEVLSSMVGAGSVGFAVVVLSGLLLCSAGVFTLMSFNVTQRRREIGVRTALGAHPRRVLATILLRSLRQLGIGVAVGLFLAIALPPLNADGIIVDATAGPIAFVAGFMVIVGFLAAVGPARRGLRIHPSEALREG